MAKRDNTRVWEAEQEIVPLWVGEREWDQSLLPPPPPPPLVLPIFIERNVRRRIGYVTIPRASHCVILMIILTQKPHYLSVLCDMFSKRVNNALGLTKASFLLIAKANSQALSECFQIL